MTKYNGLNELRSISQDDTDRPIFNANFINIVLATVDEMRDTLAVYTLLGNRSLEVVCAEIGRTVDEIEYGVYTNHEVVLIFKTLGNYTVWDDGTQFIFTNKHCGWITWGRLQAMYHNDVRHLNHAKRAPISDTGKMTLHQILTRRASAGRLISSLPKSRRR